MGNNNTTASSCADATPTVRQRAEAMMAAHEPTMAHVPEEIARLLYELQVHQIELELQNEELRRAQDELEIARARYFELYDLAPVGYVTLSAQGMIREANLAAATMLGVSRRSLLRRPLTLFIAAEDQDGYYRYRRALVQAGGSPVCELHMLRPDQAHFWARLETSVVRAATGEVDIYRTVISDITARVQAEAALQELNATLERRVDERTQALQMSEEQLRRTNAELERALRLKDEFLAMMSHELRTPLSIVLSMTEALSEEIYGPIEAAQRRALATVAQSGRHLLALLSDILDLARIAVGRETLDLVPIDVSLACQTALLMVEPAAQAKSLQLSHLIAPGIVGLRADERRLTQILVNLLNNAVKFTPAGGSVALEVTADAARGQLLFSVWDNGLGIAPADQERIFEPFIQADASLTRQYGGVGLGLALVRRLVALHGGSISLVSAVGQGSRFTVSLPWSAAENVALAVIDAPADARPAWAKPPQVLMVDDHQPTLRLYKDLLTQYGCQVLTAQSGEAAIAQVNASRPDVLLLDIQMPEVDGLSVIRRLRERPETATMPIIVLTALAMSGDRERCLAAGASVYLTKPVSLRTLIATLTAVLAPTNR